MHKKLIIFTIAFSIVDQVLKIIASLSLTFEHSIIIIKNLLSLTLAHNTGGAFSILSGNPLLLSFFGLLSIFLIYMFLIKESKLNNVEMFSYSLLLSGIIGNLLDRIRLGYVVDYIDVYIFGYDFPIFNFADMCIVIGVIILIIKNFNRRGYGRV